MTQALQLFGFVASIIVAVGYLPQIAHLARERCARGASKGAWRLWSLASLLLLVYALSIADWAISTFAAVQLTATVTIAALSTRYQGQRCRRCSEESALVLMKEARTSHE